MMSSVWMVAHTGKAAFGFSIVLLLASCGAPALKTYVLIGGAVPAASGSFDRGNSVVEVARIALPDYLDTEDIVVRRGNALERSHSGRWATRLSLGATEAVTAQLAQRRPDLLVTDAPQVVAPAYRLAINVSRLDLTTDNSATLEADWTIIPRDPNASVLRDRRRFTAAGPVASDEDVVLLEQAVLEQLAAGIDIGSLR